MKPLEAQTLDDAKFLFAVNEVKEMFKRREIKAGDFDMASFAMNKFDKEGHTCGTKHCIGGWIDIVLDGSGGNDPRNTLSLSLEINHASYNLFYNYGVREMSLSTHQAIKAIENFQAGNKNPWKGV